MAIFKDINLTFLKHDVNQKLDRSDPLPSPSEFSTPSVYHQELLDATESFLPKFLVGGVDISFREDGDGTEGVACLVVVEYPSMEMLSSFSQKIDLNAPYIPSFLSFREVPPLTELLEKYLSNSSNPVPDILLVDGNGRLHPRECGLAVMLGVKTGMVTIGVGKEYYVMDQEKTSLDTNWRGTQQGFRKKAKEILKQRGDWLGILDSGRSHFVGGAILSSPAPSSTSPIFVSSGHRISLNTALSVVLACCNNARVPEPIRLADHLGREEAKRIWGTK